MSFLASPKPQSPSGRGKSEITNTGVQCREVAARPAKEEHKEVEEEEAVVLSVVVVVVLFLLATPPPPPLES